MKHINSLNSNIFFWNTEIHPEFLHIEAKYEVDNESRDLYIFKEGSVVLWNMSEFEMRNILKFIKPFEMSSYDETIVKDETEIMPYTYSINRCAYRLKSNLILILNINILEYITKNKR